MKLSIILIIFSITVLLLSIFIVIITNPVLKTVYTPVEYKVIKQYYENHKLYGSITEYQNSSNVKIWFDGIEYQTPINATIKSGLERNEFGYIVDYSKEYKFLITKYFPTKCNIKTEFKNGTVTDINFTKIDALESIGKCRDYKTEFTMVGIVN